MELKRDSAFQFLISFRILIEKFFPLMFFQIENMNNDSFHPQDFCATEALISPFHY